MERGKDSLDELGIAFNDKRDLCVVKVEFTAAGFGYFYLNGTLTTYDWKHWRFRRPFHRIIADQNNMVLARWGDVLGFE